MLLGQQLSDNARQEVAHGRDGHKDAAMNINHTLTELAAKALLSGAVALAAFGLATGTAQAHPGFAPTSHGPVADDGNWGPPHHWCPGDRPPQTGNQGEVVWDNSVCHTYYVVDPGLGNVATNIWDGPHPPDNPPRVAPPWWAP
jgi:hypothetical protein